MEEVIVEGLDYEDFVALKTILTECTSFTGDQKEYFVLDLYRLQFESLFRNL